MEELKNMDEKWKDEYHIMGSQWMNARMDSRRRLWMGRWMDG